MRTRNHRRRHPRELVGLCLLLMVSATSKVAVWLDGTMAGGTAQLREARWERGGHAPGAGSDAR